MKPMSKYGQWMLPLFAALMICGCGGAATDSTTTAEQDELTQWAAENPSPPEVDPDAN